MLSAVKDTSGERVSSVGAGRLAHLPIHRLSGLDFRHCSVFTIPAGISYEGNVIQPCHRGFDVLAATALSGQERRPLKMPAIAELGPATLQVKGISGSTATLTAGDLDQLPQQTVKITDHPAQVTFVGVLLNDMFANRSAHVDR